MANLPCIKRALITTLFLNAATSMVMRNNALINQMVSHFQNDNYVSPEHSSSKRHKDFGQEQKPEKVMSLMQKVLCRNFPSIPCQVIIEDETLKSLIEQSIQQIRHKASPTDKSTSSPAYLTLFPVANSDELSSYLQVRNKHSFHRATTVSSKKQRNVNYWSKERMQRETKKNYNKKDSKRTPVYSGRKKMRKFYPHKIKYKEKMSHAKKDFGDYSEERLSMSVEAPDLTLTKGQHQHLSYKAEPVWRIDYMKHGEPSLNMAYEDDRLRGKLTKPGLSVVVDDNALDQGVRKELLHPDVYIKNNYVRKPPVGMDNSDNID